jgi:Cu-Zn family superoxide dismutase
VKIALSVAAVSLALALGSLAHAQDVNVSDAALVTAIDADTRTFTVTVGSEARRFGVDDSTQIRMGARTLSFADLALADRVVVTPGAGTGIPVAEQLEIVARKQEQGGDAASGASGPAEVAVALRDARGASVGEARLVDTPNGLIIEAKLRGLPPGERGFHVHEAGKCEPPHFESAGAHLAPDPSHHGFLREEGPHAGDLVNLMVPQSGRFEGAIRAPQLRLAQVLDADGSALVIHAAPDDYTSQPAGGSGDRIACGATEPAP